MNPSQLSCNISYQTEISHLIYKEKPEFRTYRAVIQAYVSGKYSEDQKLYCADFMLYGGVLHPFSWVKTVTLKITTETVEFKAKNVLKHFLH